MSRSGLHATFALLQKKLQQHSICNYIYTNVYPAASQVLEPTINTTAYIVVYIPLAVSDSLDAVAAPAPSNGRSPLSAGLWS